MQNNFKLSFLALLFIPNLLSSVSPVSDATLESTINTTALEVLTANLPTVSVLPTSPFYDLKRTWENIRLFISRTPEDRLALILKLGEIRLSETVELYKEEKISLALSTFEEYKGLIEQALQLQTQVTEPKPLQTAQLQIELQKQQSHLADLLMNSYHVQWQR